MKNPIGDDTNLGINLKWLLQLIIISATAAWCYFNITSRISQLEIDVLRLKDDVELNNTFRVKWPLGELGSLPDDLEQNIRLKYIEADLKLLEERVDGLRIKNSTN